jgi:hypothetical protein
MRLRLLRLSALVAFGAALGAGGADAPSAPPVLGNASVRDLSTTIFSPEGYRRMILKGTEARPTLARDQIEFVDMNIAVFSGDAATQLNSVILSPAARFFLHEDRAAGEGPVRLIDYRNNFEVTGEKWNYEYSQKRISIARNVKMIIHASLPDLLK